jgi:putative hemolysin
MTRVITNRPRSSFFRAAQKPRRFGFARFPFGFPRLQFRPHRESDPEAESQLTATLDQPYPQTSIRENRITIEKTPLAQAEIPPLVTVAPASPATPPNIPVLPARSLDRPAGEPVAGSLGRYTVRLATCAEDRIAACRLRFKVFNLELGEGLSASYSTGLDEDQFDMVCDHLIVEDQTSGGIVGTYRMQSGLTAGTNLGYYSAQEFEFFPYESIRHQVLELGRASVDRQHRSSEVLTLLWRGIAQYARLFGLRYLIGCSSLTSKYPQAGWTLYRQLSSSFLVSDQYFTVPTPLFALPVAPSWEDGTETPLDSIQVPKLLKTYLAVGARICGPPAWDRDFGTIDFLTLLDLDQLSPAARSRFLTGSGR